VEFRLLPVNQVLGPRFGKLFPKVRAALSDVADPASAAATLEAGGALEIQVGDQVIALGRDDVLVQTEARVGLAVLSEGGITVALETELTSELLSEGLAREVVRRVQTLRKDADYQLDDRIVTTYAADKELSAVIADWADYIRAETLSDELVPGPPAAGSHGESYQVEGHELTLGVKLA
jgi:isoleucyl-tRNA synthetase